jgi:hypothetical protein
MTITNITIIIELILRYPIFPGKDTKQQFSLIVDRLGKPGKYFCNQVRKPYFKKLLDNMNEIVIDDIEIQFPTATFVPYKYYIGRGNNSGIVRTALKSRFWWSMGDYDDWEDYNFIWT